LPLKNKESPFYPQGIEGELKRINQEIYKLRVVLESNWKSLSKILNSSIKRDENFIKKLLLVMDGLEAATDLGKELAEDNEIKDWVEGVAITKDRIADLLNMLGITPIASVGNVFDPNLHIAIGVEMGNDHTQNIIIREELKGYKLGNRVIRPAEVVVAKKD